MVTTEVVVTVRVVVVVDSVGKLTTRVRVKDQMKI